MTVQLRAPARLSATQYSTAVSCPLRLVLDSSIDEANRALPSPSPARYLGEIFHGVIEDARRGRAGNPPLRERLAECWTLRVKAAEVSAVERGDADWLPLAESCQNLESLRLRTLRLAADQRVRTGTGSGAPSTEVVVESADRSVVGRIDAIDREGDHTILRDFKSGEPVDSAGNPLPEYRRQMLLYAALFHESNGRWPDRLELVNGRGRSFEVSFDPSTATAALLECKEVLRSVQSAVAESSTLGDSRIARLARPEGDACRLCQHKPLCPGYSERLRRVGLVRLDESSFSALDAHGVIGELHPDSSGSSSVEFTHGQVARSIRHLEIRNLGGDGNPLPADPGLTVGVAIYIFGALPRVPFNVDSEACRLVVARGTRAFAIVHI